MTPAPDPKQVLFYNLTETNPLPSGGGTLEEASWRRHLGGCILEEASWRRYLGGGIWRRHLGGGILEEASWRRHLGGGIWRHLGGILEASGSIWEASGRPLRGSWKASGGTWEAPGGSPGPPGLQMRIGAKVCQNQCVLLSNVARPPVLAESGEGDTHDPRSLPTKVSKRRGGTEPQPHPLTQKTIHQNPFSVNTVWGIYCFYDPSARTQSGFYLIT